VLEEHFRRTGRRVYLSAELPVYYPGERIIAPDVIAVVDVEPHQRQRWVVAHEGRGVDFALEITLGGDRKKDLQENVERFARLGIPEYFVLDLQRGRLHGWHLEPGRDAYVPLVPQAGRWPSQILGLELALEAGKLKFYLGAAVLLEAPELIGRLTGMVDTMVEREERLQRELEELRAASQAEVQRAHAEAQRAHAEAQRAQAEARRLAERLKALGDEPTEGT
jgi:FtsZ-binding cell division protein ZapB